MSDIYGIAGKKVAKETFGRGINQPPMPERKSPVVGFIVGFMFGFLGYGIMTGDWKAAGWLFLATMALFFVIPGAGILVAGTICGGMCAARIVKSNELGGHL
jgi:hypothetical protein